MQVLCLYPVSKPAFQPRRTYDTYWYVTIPLGVFTTGRYPVRRLGQLCLLLLLLLL